MGGWADGRMGGWADGRMGGWADGRMGISKLLGEIGIVPQRRWFAHATEYREISFRGMGE